MSAFLLGAFVDAFVEMAPDEEVLASAEGVIACGNPDAVEISTIRDNGDVEKNGLGGEREFGNPGSLSSMMRDNILEKHASGLVVDVTKGKDLDVTTDVPELEVETKDSKSNGIAKYEAADASKATQEVVIALKLEDEDHKELSCGCTERTDETELPAALDSVGGKPIDRAEVVNGLTDESSVREGAEQLLSSKICEIQSECIKSAAPSLVSEGDAVECDTMKRAFEIDLNEDCPDSEDDCSSTSISATLSCVAVSGSPNGFETFCVDWSSYSSRQRQGSFEIDMKTAEGSVDDGATRSLDDQILSSACLLYGESSVEASSRRVRRPGLDLNDVDVDDNDDAPWLPERLYKSVCCFPEEDNNPSPATSSSKRFKRFNIDLNGDFSFR